VSALQSLAAEFAITVTNGEVWLSIVLALVLGGVSLLFGVWVARRVGLLRAHAPAGETVGVGLASGLMVLAAWWAAIWSGGRSSFTPVAVGFAIAVALALAWNTRPPVAADASASDAADFRMYATSRWSENRSLILTALASGVFVVAVALLYGSTMAPSPRDGVQPVENRDEAFYSVLARDLATTGTESNISPSGFSGVPGLPTQTWYHWGELWLASAVITIFGASPLAARFLIVLPVLLLAAAALTGTLVRRVARTDSRGAYLFGFLACLFLAPVPLVPGPFFSSWAVGMMFGITLYGLGAVAGLFAIYCVVVVHERMAAWALACFVGSAVALILPAQLAIAVLALVGVGSVWAIRIIQSVIATHRLPVVSPVWVRTLIAAGLALGTTVIWGMLTGHTMGGGSSASVSPSPSVPASAIILPFNASWRESVAITFLGAGVFLAIPIAWILHRRETPQADLYLGAMALLIAGAIGWGARLRDFTMFYLLFAGIAVFATPVAVIAVRILWERLRARRHPGLSVGLVVVCLVQLELGVASGIARLEGFGASDESISVSLLQAIRQLPAEAKLAYSCGPFDEVAWGTPQLLTIDAHTGRRVVPMCFEAEFPNTLLGAPRSEHVKSQFFEGAPQSAVYPDADARPSSETIAKFLRDHGIDYIYVDARHPNSLVDDAVPVATSGRGTVLRIPTTDAHLDPEVHRGVPPSGIGG
jgi:hypothetical protein